MATIIKCDRCGDVCKFPTKRYIPFRVKRIQYRIVRDDCAESVDLCFSCKEKLERFVNGAELEEVDLNGDD